MKILENMGCFQPVCLLCMNIVISICKIKKITGGSQEMKEEITRNTFYNHNIINLKIFSNFKRY